MPSQRSRKRARSLESNVVVWTTFLAKPSTITLILLLAAIVTLTIASRNPNMAPQFYSTLDTIIKVILGTWGGAMFGEHYRGKKQND